MSTQSGETTGTPIASGRETGGSCPTCRVCAEGTCPGGAEEREPGWWKRPAATIALSTLLLAAGLVLGCSIRAR